MDGGKISKFFRINDRIQAQSLRVIGADGTQLGVISLADALKLAQEAQLDLVEVAPNAQPPVARIIDFEKFRYQEAKKEAAARKNAQEVQVKEIWLSPRIEDHDLHTRLRRAEEFLSKGHKVKLTVKFKGREMAHPEVGHNVVKDALAYLGDKIKIERDSRFEGRSLTTIIAPVK